MDRRIILARHGQTEWNKAFRFQGRTNVQLTDEGKRQAYQLSERLRTWCPEVIYTSPLDRAKYTAEAIASPLKMTPVILPELEEINFGSWEGQTFDSLKSECSEEYSRWREDPFFNPPEGAETWPEIEASLNRAVDIMLESPYKRIVAVSHGGIMRALYAVIMGLDPHHTWYMDVSNCSISGIDIVGGRRYLSFTNDDRHIRPGIWGDEL